MANKRLETLTIDTTSYDVAQMLVVSASAVSSLPFTLTNANIASSMYATKIELSNPVVAISKWTVTCNDGNLVVSGTISGTTNIKLYLEHGKAV